MTEQSWLPVGIALLGGGAAGAIITALATTYRNRIQPVTYRTLARPMFAGEGWLEAARVRVTVGEGDMRREYDNLHALEVSLQNSGNIDRADFSFGLTLRAGLRAVLIDYNAPDRHHLFAEVPDVSAPGGVDKLDFLLKPFNRGDVYSLVLYVMAVDGSTVRSEDIAFGSTVSVRFGRAADLSRKLLEAARGGPSASIGASAKMLIRAVTRALGV